MFSKSAIFAVVRGAMWEAGKVSGVCFVVSLEGSLTGVIADFSRSGNVLVQLAVQASQKVSAVTSKAVCDECLVPDGGVAARSRCFRATMHLHKVRGLH